MTWFSFYVGVLLLLLFFCYCLSLSVVVVLSLAFVEPLFKSVSTHFVFALYSFTILTIDNDTVTTHEQLTDLHFMHFVKTAHFSNSSHTQNTITHRWIAFFPILGLKQLTLFLLLLLFFFHKTCFFRFILIVLQIRKFLLFFFSSFKFILKYETRSREHWLEININLNVYCGTKSHVVYYWWLMAKSDLKRMKKKHTHRENYMYKKPIRKAIDVWDSFDHSLGVCVCLCDFIVVLTLNFFLYRVVSHTQQLHPIRMKADNKRAEVIVNIDPKHCMPIYCKHQLILHIGIGIFECLPVSDRIATCVQCIQHTAHSVWRHLKYQTYKYISNMDGILVLLCRQDYGYHNY